jgi:predicted DNA-binding transcriptional regulator AlpA
MEDTTRDSLLARFGGRIIVRPEQSRDVFGWSKATSHNMVARGDLPPLRHFGGKTTGWLVPELLETLTRAPQSSLAGPRSPGRRRKSEGPTDA